MALSAKLYLARSYFGDRSAECELNAKAIPDLRSRMRFSNLLRGSGGRLGASIFFARFFSAFLRRVWLACPAAFASIGIFFNGTSETDCHTAAPAVGDRLSGIAYGRTDLISYAVMPGRIRWIFAEARRPFIIAALLPTAIYSCRQCGVEMMDVAAGLLNGTTPASTFPSSAAAMRAATWSAAATSAELGTCA